MPPPPPIHRLASVTDAQAERIRDLATRAEQVDGVAPLSEQFLLNLRPGSGVAHLLAGSGAGLVGYAQLADPGMPSSAAELLVAPGSRRQGLGRALVAALPPGARIWAHGDLPSARAVAAALGLSTVRELHRMRMRFADVELEQPHLPPVFAVRSFRPGADDEAWVRANAAAFAGHPEQGRLTVTDLHERMAQPWFDPDGLILVVPAHSDGAGAATSAEPPTFQHLLATRGSESPIAAFHWTKAPPAEVYVLGVHPAYQGLGLARPVTLLGLLHLRDLGYDEVTLYVDADNAAAMRTYRRLGFATVYVDRMVAFPAVSQDATITQ